MNTTAIERKTQQIIDQYIKELDKYSLEQLLMKPADNSWSIAQVYVHLWMSAKGFFFKKAEQCLSNENAETGRDKNFMGKIVFFLGYMPSIRVKMPNSIAVEPRQPESKEQLVAKLHEIKTMASQYFARLAKADPSLTVKHPLLGYLNAPEWIRLCDIHFKHHRGQIKRIRKHFGW